MTQQIDEFTVEILEGGLVKISTNAISPANHTSAEYLMRDLERTFGGEVSLVPNQLRPRSTHSHNHNHVKTGE